MSRKRSVISTHKLLFSITSQLRHDPICREDFNKKRKPVDPLKQRLQGTEITAVRKQHPKKQKQPEKKSNSRQHHEDFINASQSAKQYTKPLKKGHPLPLPPLPSINPHYIQCPYCSRRFNKAAAERHIQFCKDQAAHRAFAVKTTRQRLGMQPVVQRKCPHLTPAVLSLLKRRQEGANRGAPRAGMLQKPRKSLGRSTSKKASGKSGPCNQLFPSWAMQSCQSISKVFQPPLKVIVVVFYEEMTQMISIWYPYDMHTTAENEILAGNVANMDSLYLARYFEPGR
ncbi:zinc finger C2HC domain-containing protein 1B [Porphyrio hochstetteri]